MSTSPRRRRHPFRRVFTFAVLMHTLDIITTHFRDPNLEGEGNPFYQLLSSHNLTGWMWLILIKLVVVGVLSAGYLWYIRNRYHYLPREPVNSVRGLVWHGMWDGRPYPKQLWRRIFNLRKFEFGALVMMAIALPLSAMAALFFSVDNIMVGLGKPLPYLSFDIYVPLATIAMFLWWQRAYWQYYQFMLQEYGLPKGK